MTHGDVRRVNENDECVNKRYPLVTVTGII